MLWTCPWRGNEGGGQNPQATQPQGWGRVPAPRWRAPSLACLTFLSSFLPTRLSVMTRLSESSWAAICKARGTSGVGVCPETPSGLRSGRLDTGCPRSQFSKARRGVVGKSSAR